MDVRRKDFITSGFGLANLTHVIAIHAGMVAWFALAPVLMPLSMYVALSILLSAVHQRQCSEWLHEAGHYNLYPNRTINDVFANVALGGLFGVSIDTYQVAHFRHHAAETFLVDDDPDTVYAIVRSPGELVKGLLKDVTGWTALSGYLATLFGVGNASLAVQSKGSMSSLLRFLGLVAIGHLAVITALFWIGRLDAYAIYYVALMTLYPVLSRLRLYGQHLYIGNPSRLVASPAARTVDGSLLDRFFLSSRVMLYHHEHHATPTLPFRALKQICRPSDDPNVYTRGHWPVLRAVARSLY